MHEELTPPPAAAAPDKPVSNASEALLYSDRPNNPHALPGVNNPDLVRPCDIRGVLHSHSRYGDGAHSLEAMVETARAIGLEYLGISDHYLSDHHQDGLDIEAVNRQRREIEALDARFPDFDILQGVELDARVDGTLPLSKDELKLFDYVIVSLPACEECSDAEWTDRALRVLDNPLVSVLGKPVGDLMLRPAPVPMDMKRVLKQAASANIALEIDANPHCTELDWSHCNLAQEMGAYMAISPDAHRAARLVDFRHGAEMAREAGICCRSILNTLSALELREFWRR